MTELMPSISNNQTNGSERADREFGDNAGAVRRKIMLTDLMPSISSNQGLRRKRGNWEFGDNEGAVRGRMMRRN